MISAHRFIDDGHLRITLFDDGKGIVAFAQNLDFLDGHALVLDALDVTILDGIGADSHDLARQVLLIFDHDSLFANKDLPHAQVFDKGNLFFALVGNGP